jgi:integrase
MPSVQRGQVYKTRGGSWAYRYYENGRRRQVGGFPTKGPASEALENALKRVRGGYQPPPTLAALVDDYLEQHIAEQNSTDTLTFRLKHAKDAFGHVRVDRLMPQEVGAWRRRLPAGSAYEIHKALRQVLAAAVRWRLIDENPAKLVPNPAPKRAEIQPFGSWGELEAVADELGPWGAIPLFAAGTGLRPEEWIALEWRDVDRQERAVTVRRAFTAGQVKEWGKTDRSRRRVPLRQRTLDLLEQIPRRLDSRLVFPAIEGGYLNLHNWRAREWKPAVTAAGIEPERRIYDCRHTYATFSLAAGVSLFTLSRRMGTSVQMIDKTYGHLAPDAEQYELGLLDAYDTKQIETREAGPGP